MSLAEVGKVPGRGLDVNRHWEWRGESRVLVIRYLRDVQLEMRVRLLGI